jgi:hypothetical protein
LAGQEKNIYKSVISTRNLLCKKEPGHWIVENSSGSFIHKFQIQIVTIHNLPLRRSLVLTNEELMRVANF